VSLTKTLGDAAFQNKDKVYEKPEARAVMVDITDAAVSNTEYEASIKVHQGREPNMYKKSEKKEMMIKCSVPQIIAEREDSPSYTLTCPLSRQVSQSSLYPTLFELQGYLRFSIYKNH
jgi:hypothetical protein